MALEEFRSLVNVTDSAITELTRFLEAEENEGKAVRVVFAGFG